MRQKLMTKFTPRFSSEQNLLRRNDRNLRQSVVRLHTSSLQPLTSKFKQTSKSFGITGKDSSEQFWSVTNLCKNRLNQVEKYEKLLSLAYISSFHQSIYNEIHGQNIQTRATSNFGAPIYILELRKWFLRWFI